MKESVKRGVASAQSPESPFDSFLREALTSLYKRRAELNRLIHYLDSAPRNRRAAAVNRASSKAAT